MRNKIALLLSVVFVLLGIIALCMHNTPSAFTGNCIKNPDAYILEFEKMNQEDSHVLSVRKNGALSVECDIERGQVDLVIGMEGSAPIYTGNDMSSGEFEVIVPEDGDYRIAVTGKRAAGYLRIHVKQ